MYMCVYTVDVDAERLSELVAGLGKARTLNLSAKVTSSVKNESLWKLVPRVAKNLLIDWARNISVSLKRR